MSATIKSILKSKGNDKCIDCGSEDPQFTSINNAVFICFNCELIHKSLGSEISETKNISNLTDSETEILSNGGNERFLNNLISYLIVKNNNHLSLDEKKIKVKYVYKASDYYRKLIKYEMNIEKLDEPDKPSLKEGKEVLVGFEDFIAKEDKSLFGKVGSFFTKTRNSIKENIEKYEIKEKIKTVGDKTVVAAKEASAYIKEKAEKVKKSEVGMKIGEVTDKGIDKIKNVFAGFKDDKKNENIKKEPGEDIESEEVHDN